MGAELNNEVVDVLTLRFTGEDDEGLPLHELRAAHVAEVLQGVVGLASDFDKAGAFSLDGPGRSEILVRPAREGSFLIEVVRTVVEDPDVLVKASAVLGIPSLGTVIWWATRSALAEVKQFDHLDNGNVRIMWQDDTAQEVPLAAREELNKRGQRRKKQLRQTMAPLSDRKVSALEVAQAPEVVDGEHVAPPVFVLTRPDYEAVRPDDEVEEAQDIFEVEAQMSAIDFDDPTKWRVKTKDRKRSATVEDQAFLARVGNGLAIRKSDIFRLPIREDATRKNGRTKTVWTVLRVEEHRRAAGDGS